MTPDNLPATRRPVAVDLSQPLTDLSAALQLADTLSRSELVPRALAGKPASVFHVLMTGQALGLHWTESLRVIYSAGPGQIGLRGGFLLSQLRKAKHRYTITETPDACTFTLVRGDTSEEFEATFTVEDAIRGGLLKRAANGELVAFSRDNKPLPWMAWTKRMLRWRAVSDCVSFAAPEVALGFEIEGAEAAPEPEVVLKPQHLAGPEGSLPVTPVPPEPDAGEAAPGDDQAAQAQLAELNAQFRVDPGETQREFRPATDAEADAMAAEPSAEPEVGGTPEVGGNPAAEPVAHHLAEVPTGNHPESNRMALERQLAAQFTALGWDANRHRISMLNACTMFAGRRIKSVRDLTVTEMAKLSMRLTKISKDTAPEAQPVALADAVAGWAEKFRETNPDGYEKLEK
jgi:hypothetical protein